MKKSKIEKVLNKLDFLENPKYQNGDIGDAKLFSDVFNGECGYVPICKHWYVYDGIKWDVDYQGTLVMRNIMDLTEVILDVLYTNANKYSNIMEMIKHYKVWEKNSKRKHIIEDAKSICSINYSKFDSNHYLINCLNGTFDLKTNKFRKHSSKDMITKLANVNYNPNAKSELFNDFLDEIMTGDKDKEEFLQKMFGYSLTGKTNHECMFILYGPSTRNGKTTLINSVINVMGNYACTVNAETLTSKKYANPSGPSEDVLRMNRARLINVPEPAKDMVFSAETIKAMTGNEIMLARGMFASNSDEFKPTFKIIIDTNHLPRINDMTVFDSHRIHVVPFNKHFDVPEQDIYLKDKLESEEIKSFIFNWMIDGLNRFYKEGLSPCDSIIKATEEYRAKSDTVQSFIDECLSINPRFEEKTVDLYYSYYYWCISKGLVPENQKFFNSKLGNIGSIKKKRPITGGTATNVFIGAQLNGSTSNKAA